MSLEYAVETVNLTKVFGNFKAVDNLNLKIRKGEIFGLLGPNGAGKTTTIRMILGLIKPTKGVVRVFGIQVEKERRKVLKMTGYMPQRFSLYEDLTVEENLMLYALLYGYNRREAKERVKELLEELLLEEFKDRLAGNLSGGMKQRLALAVALVHKPKLVIVDEPTAGVDPPLRRYFWKYFKDLNKRGVTIIVTTHYMDEAENCDRLALIFRGRKIAEGTPLEIKRLAFGGDIVEILLEALSPPKLEGIEGVKKILESERYNGTVSIKVLVDDASSRLISIVKRLESNGVKVVRASQVYVGLEDAFIKLIEEQAQ